MSRRLALACGRTRPRLWLWGAAALGLVLALAPGELAPPSLRAAAAAGAVGAAALLARLRLVHPAAERRLAVLSRQALSREAGLALVELDGRALLVGWGGGPVRLLHAAPPLAPEKELPSPPEAQP